MAAPRTTFKQADLTRAAKGAVAAGMDVDRIEIDPEGKISVIMRGSVNAGGANPCDRLLK